MHKDPIELLIHARGHVEEAESPEEEMSKTA